MLLFLFVKRKNIRNCPMFQGEATWTPGGMRLDLIFAVFKMRGDPVWDWDFA